MPIQLRFVYGYFGLLGTVEKLLQRTYGPQSLKYYLTLYRTNLTLCSKSFANIDSFNPNSPIVKVLLLLLLLLCLPYR